ncbi:transcriptional regulator TbsP domain-containing protein [Halorubrum vacuolatum]|uniref:Uncharacterized protein n=1 Tax=Halorubrum vacuolatum TaxID=63740 RepID=A0A238WXH4_HALVU|nr:DUF5821 family protein [Halorubrum vacuolatum]SNR51206.1 hypothetical protein SAMN06264855_11122 [Halorubrum vacuolatum]
MATIPALELVSGTLRFDRYVEPLLVDPDPSLFQSTVETLRSSLPAVETDHDAANTRHPEPSDPNIPRLRVLARESTLTAITDGFHPAGRVAALLERDLLSLRVLSTPQPNTVLLGRTETTVLVSTPAGVYAIEAGNDSRLRDRYEPRYLESDRFRLRVPSRRRIHQAFTARCGASVASDVLAVLAAGADPDEDTLDARHRAALAAARCGVDDYEFRRACEEAGLGSPSTFTAVKRRLVDAGLLTTERVPQPVGRPRQRLRPGTVLDERVDTDDPPATLLSVARERLDVSDATVDPDD